MFDLFKRKKPQDKAEAAKEQETQSVEEQSSVDQLDVESPIVEERAEAEVVESAPETATESVEIAVPAQQDDVQEKPQAKKAGFFSRLKDGLGKTRSGFSEGVASLLLGKKEIDDDLLEDLETQLVMADVGIEATQTIMAKLTERVSRKELDDSDALFESLIKELQDMLASSEKPLVIDEAKKPYVILMVGINGVGKTTTIGKLAKQYQSQGKSVMLAAGDTFRAAAVVCCIYCAFLLLSIVSDPNLGPKYVQKLEARIWSLLLESQPPERNLGDFCLRRSTYPSKPRLSVTRPNDLRNRCSSCNHLFFGRRGCCS